jgi:hypothetical protein
MQLWSLISLVIYVLLKIIKIVPIKKKFIKIIYFENILW